MNPLKSIKTNLVIYLLVIAKASLYANPVWSMAKNQKARYRISGGPARIKATPVRVSKSTILNDASLCRQESVPKDNQKATRLQILNDCGLLIKKVNEQNKSGLVDNFSNGNLFAVVGYLTKFNGLLKSEDIITLFSDLLNLTTTQRKIIYRYSKIRSLTPSETVKFLETAIADHYINEARLVSLLKEEKVAHLLSLDYNQLMDIAVAMASVETKYWNRQRITNFFCENNLDKAVTKQIASEADRKCKELDSPHFPLVGMISLRLLIRLTWLHWFFPFFGP